MSKKFTPSVGKKKKLDAFVNDKVEITETSKKQEKVAQKAKIKRVQHGYLIRPEYIKKVTFLSASMDKKKWEVLEEALEEYFNKHKDILDKFDI